MWFKVDDKLHDHRKARKAKKAAMGVWVLAGSWCMDNLSDGFVPDDVLARWGTRADAKALVEAGLWSDATRDGEKGWQFHDWSRFQPSAAVTAATKAAEAEAGVRGNHMRWHAQRGITDQTCSYCYRVPDQEPDGVPDVLPESGPDSPPIRPVPVPEPHTEPKGSAAIDGPATQALIGEWIEHSAERPPKRIVGQVSRELRILLVEDGIPVDVVRRGLAAWARKGAHPASLASFVHENQSRTIAPSSSIRYLPNGDVDPASLPPVEDDRGMKMRPSR